MIFIFIYINHKTIIHKNTKAFLIEIFPSHETVALAVNNLLQMGFYLIALGYGYKRLKISYSGSWFSSYEGDEVAKKMFMTTQKELVEELASKLGGFTLFVGALLFFNLFLSLLTIRILFLAVLNLKSLEFIYLVISSYNKSS
mgnify:CR=1 FL=1